MTGKSNLNWPPNLPTPCPENYFGRGRGYQLEEHERAKFMEQMDEWETNHPDDPTGNVYLTKYEALQEQFQKENPKAVIARDHLMSPPIGGKTWNIEPGELSTQVYRAPGRQKLKQDETTMIRLILPLGLRNDYQAKCFGNNVSMSDVFRQLIKKYVDGEIEL